MGPFCCFLARLGFKARVALDTAIVLQATTEACTAFKLFAKLSSVCIHSRFSFVVHCSLYVDLQDKTEIANNPSNCACTWDCYVQSEGARWLLPVARAAALTALRRFRCRRFRVARTPLWLQVAVAKPSNGLRC